MPTATGHTAAISARKVIDTDVFDTTGKKIGEVKDVVLEKTSNNVMFAIAQPRLIAIFDWEMATIGDPLADLGWLLSTWGDPGDPPGTRRRNEGPVLTTAEGFPGGEEMAALYGQKSGRTMKHFAFYHVLAVYKLAIILEGLYMHYLEKTASNPGAAEFEWHVPVLVDRMHRLMGE